MSKNILGIFDSGDIESVTTLIEKLEESSFDYLKLEGDGVKIVIGKNGVAEETAAAAPRAAAPVNPVAAPVAIPAPVSAAPAADAVPAPVTPPVQAVSDQAGITVIKSPSYGLFYAQPEPSSPPYVKLGDIVKEGETMGLVEIMKTFTAIAATVTGEVVAIHVKNEQVLEPDLPLFSIKAK